MLERFSQSTFVFVRLRLDIDEISHLVDLRDQEYPGRKRVEELGKELIGQQVWELSRVREFVSTVYQWSGNVRNLKRLLDANPEFPAKLREASSIVVKGNGSSASVATAIWTLSEMGHLRPSYASKLLRFLHPDKVVILDSIVRLGMGLPDNKDGYMRFHDDCRTIQSGFDARNSFTLSDIEAAIFMKLRGQS